MRFRFRLAAVCAASLTAAAGPTLAEPTLWAARSGASTVYLFGTIHAVHPSQAWRTRALDRAFKASTELWIEVPLPVAAKGGVQPFTAEGAQHIAELAATYGTTKDGPTLSSRLSPDEAAQLAALAAPVPMARVDRMRPWAAVGLLSGNLTRRIGVSPTTSADIVLDQDAVAADKRVHTFETIEQQLRFFADLSPDEELAYLCQSLAEASEGRARLEAMERAWFAGDDEAFSQMVYGRMRTQSPLLYRRLVLERNQHWIPQIETLLKSPGVRFIAVGDAHVVGPDGLVALLKKDGFRVERVH